MLQEPVTESFYTVDKPYVYTDAREIHSGRVSIRFNFQTRMDRDSYDGHIHIDPLPAGDFEFYAYDSALTVTFLAEKDVEYTIMLDAAMAYVYGYTLGEDAVFHIASRTAPPPPPPSTGSYEFAPRFPIVMLGTYAETLSLPVTVTGEATLNWKLYQFEPGMFTPYAPTSTVWLEHQGGQNFTDGLPSLDFHQAANPDDPCGHCRLSLPGTGQPSDLCVVADADRAGVFRARHPDSVKAALGRNADSGYLWIEGHARSNDESEHYFVCRSIQ